MTPEGQPRRGSVRGTSRFLELAALSGFAVTQPVLAVLGRSADYLVFVDARPLQILVVALFLAVLPPVALWLLEVLCATLFPRSAAGVHRLLVGGLLMTATLQVIAVETSLGPVTRWVAAAAVGVLLGWAHARWQPVQLWTRLAAPAPLVFAALFLLASPVAGLLRTSDPPPVVVAAGETTSPVVLMVFDEFPLLTLLDAQGRIDDRLFPNLAALAQEANFFRNATSVAARTTHAVPSILTGRYPHADIAPNRSEYPDNLFSLLQSSHRIHAFESVTSLCPRSACPRQSAQGGTPWRLFDDAARIWLWSVTPSQAGSSSPLGTWFAEEPGREAARFGEFLASMDGVGTPFHFVHVVLPHAPWQYLPDGLRYPPLEVGLVGYDERTDEAWPALVDRQRHVLQAMYVDGLVGQAVERLKEVGLYDRTTLLVTADHGISFEPGQDTRNLSPETAHEIAWVPFLLKSPGQTAGMVSDDNVMTVDVAPTLAELAGSVLPWRADGMSLPSGPARDAAKVWFNQPGAALDLDADGAYPKVLSGVAHIMATPDEGVEGMFKVGPFADMVGTAADDYARSQEPGLSGRVDDLPSYDDIDVGTGTVPALVSGYLELSPEAPRPPGVAIVLNGTIAAVSDLYAEGDRAHRFVALVSPTLMKPGPNSIGLFAVDIAEHGERTIRQVDVQPLGAQSRQ